MKKSSVFATFNLNQKKNLSLITDINNKESSQNIQWKDNIILNHKLKNVFIEDEKSVFDYEIRKWSELVGFPERNLVF